MTPAQIAAWAGAIRAVFSGTMAEGGGGPGGGSDSGPGSENVLSGNYATAWANIIQTLYDGGSGSTWTNDGDGSTSTFAFANDQGSSGAWQVTHQWDDNYTQMFQSQIGQITQALKDQGGDDTCEDYALNTITTFAMQNGFPFVFQTGARTFDATSTSYNNFGDFLHDLLTYSAASDLQNDNNTQRVNTGDLEDGDLILLNQQSDGIAHHAQVVTNITYGDDGSVNGINIMQGNFGIIPKHLGSNDPNDWDYYGTKVQSGYWNVQSNTYYNWTTNTTIQNYSSAGGNVLEYREWNFMGWNK